MIFTDVIHDDFKKIITRYSNESELLWTPEKGYRDKELKFPIRANVGSTYHALHLNETDKENVCGTKDFTIFIHKPNEIITPFHETQALRHDERMVYSIKITSHRTDEAMKAFSPETRKCYFEGEKELKFFKTYTKPLCEWECKANETLKVCGCAKFSMPRDQNTKVCHFLELLCVMNVKNTRCNCFPPCNDIKYTHKIERFEYNKRLYSYDVLPR